MENINLYMTIGASILGVIGSVLGVVNFIIARDRDRVKLRVSPEIILHLENDKGNKTKIVQRIGIQIVNLSSFPVSIRDVGFISAKYHKKTTRITFLDKVVEGGGRLPQRMESRTMIRVYHPNPEMFTNINEIKAAYAETDCGKEVKGSSKKIIKKLKKYAKEIEQSSVDNNTTA